MEVDDATPHDLGRRSGASSCSPAGGAVWYTKFVMCSERTHRWPPGPDGAAQGPLHRRGDFQADLSCPGAWPTEGNGGPTCVTYTKMPEDKSLAKVRRRRCEMRAGSMNKACILPGSNTKLPRIWPNLPIELAAAMSQARGRIAKLACACRNHLCHRRVQLQDCRRLRRARRPLRRPRRPRPLGALPGSKTAVLGC